MGSFSGETLPYGALADFLAGAFVALLGSLTN